MGEQPDPVAELEHQVRPRVEVGVATANLYHDRRLLARQIEIYQRTANHRRPGCKHPQVVEVPAVLGNATGCRLAKAFADLVQRVPARSYGEECVVLDEDEVGRRRLVAMLAAQRHDLQVRQLGHQLAQSLAEDRGVQRHLKQFHARAGRHLDLWLEHDEREVPSLM
jgi:hypothetical protein